MAGLDDFPRTRQMNHYDCGRELAYAMLEYYEIHESFDDFCKRIHTDQVGTPVQSIIDALNSYGLEAKLAEPMSLDELKKSIDQDIPVMLMLPAHAPEGTDYTKTEEYGHFVGALKYYNYDDPLCPQELRVSKEEGGVVVFEDPYAPNKMYMTYRELERRWHDIDTDNRLTTHLAIVVKGPKPADLRKIVHMP
jgi:hypothetical protein